MIDSFVNDYFAEFLEGVKNFHWCSLSYLCKSWHKHTKYRFILDLVSKGLSLDLKELLFENINSFHPLSGKKTEIVSNEIIKLLQNKVIVCSIPQNNEFLSHIFTRNKKDTKKKTIFILNKFNKFINWKHIKKRLRAYITLWILSNWMYTWYPLTLRVLYFLCPFIKIIRDICNFDSKDFFNLNVCPMI